MSRVGKQPVPVPSGVKVEKQGQTLKVTGPKGTLERTFSPDMSIEVGESEIVVTRPSEKREHRSLHGLTRALINNMVLGASEGFKKTLVIEGIGYRASMQGNNLNLMLGFSHPVSVEPPEGVEFAVEGTQTVHISGYDKEKVGQMAADIRAMRPPEPYKGKGVRYENEYVRRKVSKAAVS